MITLEEYKQYFKSKKDEDINNYGNALFGYNFINRYTKVNELIKTIFNDEITLLPYGDYTSKVMVVLDTEDKEILELISKVLVKVNNYTLDELYITYYIKNTNDFELLKTTLNKEIDIIKPKLLINFSSLKENDIIRQCDKYTIPKDDIKKLAIYKNGKGIETNDIELVKQTGVKLWSIMLNTKTYILKGE